MEKKKIIFMDCDGVLNYTNWYTSDRNPGNLYGEEGDIDPLCVERIKKICDETGAKIVLSSDWRLNYPAALERLNLAGFNGYIIDKTPFNWLQKLDGDSPSRGSEIEDWLLKHQDIYDYVIIDDRTDFTIHQTRYHFVHIDSMYGITDEDMNKAIEILSR